MNLQDLSATELVQRLVDLSGQLGNAKCKAMPVRRQQYAKRDRRYDGMIGSLRVEVMSTVNELYRRLGIEQSPEITNRPAFLMIAAERRRASCERCRLKPPKGRGLQFWTVDLTPIPLPLMMAWGGVPVNKVADALLSCLPLCRRCAKKAGAKLLSNGNPDLRLYDVEVK